MCGRHGKAKPFRTAGRRSRWSAPPVKRNLDKPSKLPHSRALSALVPRVQLFKHPAQEVFGSLEVLVPGENFVNHALGFRA